MTREEMQQLAEVIKASQPSFWDSGLGQALIAGSTLAVGAAIVGGGVTLGSRVADLVVNPTAAKAR